jgi:TM2 domain-containing membrane protein YozV
VPVVSAIAITLIVIGTTLGWFLSAIGGVILVVAAIRWVRDTRRDLAALPERHE